MDIIYPIGILGWCAAAWRWGDWRHIDKYLASIYLMIFGNLLYDYITWDHPLWLYLSPTLHIPHSGMDLLITFIVFPCTTVLFLSRYPRGFRMQVGYTLLWALFYSSLEWLVVRLRLMQYDHHWSIWWSLLLNSLCFPMLRLNQKKPYLAYILLIVIAAGFFYGFGFTLKDVKLKD